MCLIETNPWNLRESHPLFEETRGKTLVEVEGWNIYQCLDKRGRVEVLFILNASVCFLELWDWETLHYSGLGSGFRRVAKDSDYSDQ